MPIEFSNGYRTELFVASGALGFDGKGWPWEWPLRWVGLIDPTLFTIVGKTISLDPMEGNYRPWKPLECFRWIDDGTVNKVGLTNMGFRVFFEEILSHVVKENFVVSLFGEKRELLWMSRMLEEKPLAAIELNPSCPNRCMDDTETIIDATRAVSAKTRHPVILKLSVAQDYVTIARQVVGYAEAISLNSVPWEMVNPGKTSPLAKLQKRVGGGGGGVSGKAAQFHNWLAVIQIKATVPEMPVIAPDIWEYRDIAFVRDVLNADAVSFGAIHAKHFFLGSVLPTMYVRRLFRARGEATMG
jgi:hypothetical protein